MPSLEIACFNVTSALLASSSGASRIEFCADASLGGITPVLTDFISIRLQIKIPIFVMIRPRGRNFVYAVEEFAQMKRDLLVFAKEGADGFVFGILDEKGKVDKGKCKQLVALAGGKRCTFHRAFDEVEEVDMQVALEDVISCGFSYVLTGGGKETAAAGENKLKELVGLADDRVEAIVGGGVRSHSVESLMLKTRASWFHSSAVVDGGDTASECEVKALKEVLDR